MAKKKVEQAHPDASGLGTGSVQQLALAEALRKVVPFTAGEKEYRENLKHVWFEAKGGTLEITTSDGYRIAHAILEATWPEGNWLLEGAACKQLSYAYSQGEVVVEVYDGKLVVGDREIPVVDSKWVEYRQFYDEVQQGMKAMLIVARKNLNNAYLMPPSSLTFFSIARLTPSQMRGTEGNICGLTFPMSSRMLTALE